MLWLFARGVMPLYTPLGGSWRNIAESIQRVLKRCALDGQHPGTPGEIAARFEAVAGHGHAVGGSGAETRRPIRRCRPSYTDFL